MTITHTPPRTPLEAARQLAPLIRSYADQIEEMRELPRPLFEAMADAGLFHLAVPRSVGGGEIDLPTYIEVLQELGKADASTAWVVNQGAIFATYAAAVPEHVARLVWTDSGRGVVANTPVSSAKVIAVEGGYRVSGRFGFGTGSRHASWLAPRGHILDDGQPRLQRDGEPDARFFLVPVEEAEVLDTWHTRGMRGTGTHHFKVDDVFVPEERSFTPTNQPLVGRGPLYTVPRTLLFACGDAATALGVAQRSIDALVELAGAKTPTNSGSLLRDQPLLQFDLGQALAHLHSGRALLRQTVREIWDAATSTGVLTPAHLADLRLAATHTLRLAVEVVDIVYNDAGASAVYLNNPIQRLFQDIHVISQHIQARRTYYELVGRFELGLDASFL